MLLLGEIQFSFLRHVIIIIILLFWGFFQPALADGFSLEAEWQQVSSSLQDSSQYSGRFQQCYSLNCLIHPLIFMSSNFSTNPLVIVSSTTITVNITITLIFHSFLCYLARSWYLCLFLIYLSFTLCEFVSYLFVTYWPSTEPSIKRCTCVKKRKQVDVK